MNAATNGTARESFGSREMVTTGETHTAALVAAATAKVNARYVMALQRPRSWDEVRVRLLAECARPGFAEGARYNKPIGKDGLHGPSIRFAEACFRYAGNGDAPVTTTFEDRMKRVLSVGVIDFETNASYSTEITVEKTVERKSSKDRVVVAQRTNTYGETVFIVEATEDELLNKQNALVSKSVRTQILRMVPGDIIEECMTQCQKTLKDRATKDPAGEKKRLCDAFATVGVFPTDLAALLGHSLAAVQPAELVELREIYATLKDGETTWAAVLEAKRGAPKGGDGAKKSTLEDDLRDAPPPAAATPPAATPPPSKPAAEAPTKGGKKAKAAAAPKPEPVVEADPGAMSEEEQRRAAEAEANPDTRERPMRDGEREPGVD